MKRFYTCVSRGKNELLYRGVNSAGQRICERVKFKPHLYIPAKPDVETEFKNLQGKHLERKVFDSINSAKDFLEKYKDVEGFTVYGQTNYVNQFIQRAHTEEIEFDYSKICKSKIDIETTCENGFPDIEKAIEEIICATVYNSLTQEYHVFTNHEYGGVRKDDFTKYATKIKFHQCDDEKSMLKAILDLWVEMKPDVVTGWNIEGFDIPYLVNRLYNLFNEEFVNNSLSVWGDVREREVVFEAMGKTLKTYLIGGTGIIDMLDAYKKFAPVKQESYRLDHIASVELNEGKLSHDEYSSLHEFYKKDFAKFVEYNFKDVWLLTRLEEKLHLVEFIVTMAYMSKVNYNDVFFPVRTIESLCHDYLRGEGIIVKAKTEKGEKTEKYEGAYVKTPQLGIHNWVVSFDLKSLYPSIIQQLNLSPETLLYQYENKEVNVNSLLQGDVDLEYATKYNISVAANGHHFSRDNVGFLPTVITRLIDGRDVVKMEMLQAERDVQVETNEDAKQRLNARIPFLNLKQLALKILANSIYGAMGNQYFAFYDTRLATAITLHGQFAIRYIESQINLYMNTLMGTDGKDYAIYMDTDSIYVAFDDVVKKFRPDETDENKIVDFIDAVCKKKVQPWINISYQRMADYTNAFQNRMIMKREVIASRGVWKAKKMYALRVFDSENVRYKEPKLKIMGLETARSSTPQFCRTHLKKSLDIILTKQEKDIQDYVEYVKDEWDKLDPHDMAFPRGVKGIEKYTGSGEFESGTPIHVKAAFNYNQMVKLKKLEGKYREIRDGDKIKFCHLKNANPSRIKVIGFPLALPKEFGLDEYIDRDMQFDKSFLEPLRKVLEPVGWTPEPFETLEDLFV